MEIWGASLLLPRYILEGEDAVQSFPQVIDRLEEKIGAGEEDRTLDIDLGKVALYR